MDEFDIASNTLNLLEIMVNDRMIELLKEVHKKFLSDLDFGELIKILEGKKKEKYIIKHSKLLELMENNK
jgi:hypothetical protein